MVVHIALLVIIPLVTCIAGVCKAAAVDDVVEKSRKGSNCNCNDEVRKHFIYEDHRIPGRQVQQRNESRAHCNTVSITSICPSGYHRTVSVEQLSLCVMWLFGKL